MGISSLGVGSGILTQDVLDQLREADEAGRITPIELNLANENDKQDSLKIIDASMTNFVDSISAIKNATLWDDRKATVDSGTSVEVSAISNTDVQSFSIEVLQLATKKIEQSAAFSAKTDAIGDGTGGTFKIQVGTGVDADAAAISITYDAGATLDDLKKLINDEAGDLVDATIVQLNSGEYHLMLSSAQTGANTDISMTDIAGALNTNLTTGSIDVQAGQNAQFTFNGSSNLTPYERASNTIDDLITGLTMTFKETGVSNVSIEQDRTSILEKFDSFVEKYNSNMHEFDTLTKVSTESDERGIFSSDSTIKSMKRAIQDMLESVGGGVGTMLDYGFDVDKDGKMTLDKTVLEAAMDDNPTNVQAFFSGGDFTNTDTSVTTVTGAFAEMAIIIEGYTKTNQTLDQLKESLSQSISSLEDRKISATERLDSKYAILKKQFAAYDAMINKFNTTSSMFTTMTDALSSSS